MNDTFEAIKAGPVLATEDLDPMIVQMAIIARASLKEYGLNSEQYKSLINRFSKIYNAYPQVKTRILECVDTGNPFWSKPSDTVLSQLHRAGILVDTLAV